MKVNKMWIFQHVAAPVIAVVVFSIMKFNGLPQIFNGSSLEQTIIFNGLFYNGIISLVLGATTRSIPTGFFFLVASMKFAFFNELTLTLFMSLVLFAFITTALTWLNMTKSNFWHGVLYCLLAIAIGLIFPVMTSLFLGLDVTGFQMGKF